MSLITFDNVSLSFGNYNLLDKINFNIKANDKVCLLGRNGEGKSSLLKLILNPKNIDAGEIRIKDNLTVGYLDQHLPEANDQSVYDYIAEALQTEQHLLQEYELLSQQSAIDNLAKIERMQQQIEALDAWNFSVKIDRIINLLELPKDKCMHELSGGWRRRVALGRALVKQPDLLLLDEPTNHLDIIAIAWLKKFIQQFNNALLFITHDRDFLRSCATSLLDLDRGNLTSWQCNYDDYMKYKEDLLATEQEHNKLFDKKLAQEEVWIRQGIKARRTRNEGRVRKLQELRKQRQQRVNLQGNASIAMDDTKKSGKLVIEAKNISHSYNNKKIIANFSLRLMKNDKIGLIGANGIGKSTLIKILLQYIEPNAGEVNLGTNLEIAYFDQQRAQLDLEKSVIDNVAEGKSAIVINGKSRHVIGYLGDFLFSPERCLAPVKILSGGERNRLILARLFSKPTNFLVLDEPTNDLDVETLELLESLLVDFTGTILLVSHDIEFLNNTVSSSLVFYPNGIIKEYVGGFNDWLLQGGNIDSLTEAKQLDTQAITKSTNDNKQQKNKPEKKHKKLSYKLRLELNNLPDEIEDLEEQLSKLQNETEQGNFYNLDSEYTQKIWQQIADLQKQIEFKMERWQELDSLD